MRQIILRWIILLALGAVLLGLSACGTPAAPAAESPGDAAAGAGAQTPAEPAAAESETAADGPSASELAALITADIDMTNWQEADEAALRRSYAWEDGTAPADAVFYLAATNIQADELTLLALPDKNAARAVLPVLEGRLAEQKKNFAGYLPEQEFLLENAVCMSKGRYALLVVSAQAENIRTAFEAAVE